MTHEITEKDKQAIRSHNLREEAVRLALAGFIDTHCREVLRVETTPAFWTGALKVYIAAVDQLLDTAVMQHALGRRPGDRTQ